MAPGSAPCWGGMRRCRAGRSGLRGTSTLVCCLLIWLSACCKYRIKNASEAGCQRHCLYSPTPLPSPCNDRTEYLSFLACEHFLGREGILDRPPKDHKEWMNCFSTTVRVKFNLLCGLLHTPLDATNILGTGLKLIQGEEISILRFFTLPPLFWFVLKEDTSSSEGQQNSI